MSKFSTRILLEERTPRKDGTYPVKLRVTIERKSRYFGLDYNLTEKDFKKVYSDKPRNQYKKLLWEFTKIEDKA